MSRLPRASIGSSAVVVRGVAVVEVTTAEVLVEAPPVPTGPPVGLGPVSAAPATEDENGHEDECHTG
jgi:hypothetical protein